MSPRKAWMGCRGHRCGKIPAVLWLDFLSDAQAGFPWTLRHFPGLPSSRLPPATALASNTRWAAARLPATGLTCHWLDLPLGSGPLHGGGEGTEKEQGGFCSRRLTGDLSEPSVWDKCRGLADTAICWSPVMCATTAPQLLFCIARAFHGGKAE